MPRNFLLCLSALVLMQAPCLAGFREIEQGVFTEDFEDGHLDGWQFGNNLKGEIAEIGGNSVLTVKCLDKKPKGSVVPLPVRDMQDFSVQFRIQGVGGIHFRNGYKVFFKGNGDMWFRRPGAMLVRWVRSWMGRDYDLQQFHTIEVFCVGPIIRIYVDGSMELEMLDHNPVAKPIYLRHGHACFDDITVRAHIPPHEGVIALPQDEGQDFWEESYYDQALTSGTVSGPRIKDRALVFPVSESVRPDIQVLDCSDSGSLLEVELTVDNFHKKPITGPFSKSVDLSGGHRKEMRFDFGRMASGFYRMTIRLSREGRTIRTTSYPLLINEHTEPVTYREPAIPVGVFLKSIVWKPLHTKTYWHGIADIMTRHNLNTVVATGGCHREFREIFHRYGISSLVRTADKLDHPAVIGLVNTRKDPEHMKKVQAGVDKPVLTYLPAKNLGTGLDSDPRRIWEATKPKVRMLIPFSESGHDLMKYPEGEPAPWDTLRTAQSSFATPLWVILQVSGQKAPDGTYGDPTPAQIRAQTHLALAHGAKGIMYYAFQRLGGETGMVDHISLKPLDERLKTVGNLAGLIDRHSALLSSLTADSLQIRCDNPAVEAVPARNRGGRYVYVVNKNAINKISCALVWPTAEGTETVHDVFSDTDLPAERRGRHVDISITLDPGEGKLLALSSPNGR